MYAYCAYRSRIVRQKIGSKSVWIGTDICFRVSDTRFLNKRYTTAPSALAFALWSHPSLYSLGAHAMSVNMYQITIPVFTHVLNSLSHILNKGAAHAEAKKIEPNVFITDRLAPDMFPLSRQVQIATDAVKGCAARLANVEIPSFADTETTFPELQERIAKTLVFLKTITPEQVNGSEDRTVTLKVRGNDMQLPGLTYLNQFAMPNLYFHVTTAYAILRHNGVELGKMDFLGNS